MSDSLNVKHCTHPWTQSSLWDWISVLCMCDKWSDQVQILFGESSAITDHFLYINYLNLWKMYLFVCFKCILILCLFCNNFNIKWGLSWFYELFEHNIIYNWPLMLSTPIQLSLYTLTRSNIKIYCIFITMK